MSHIALYRLWRPQTFKDVVGQEHIIQTLHHSLQEGRINHAYLFSGPRGTGKTTAARIMAKAINCEHGPATEPCNACSACQRMTEGSVMDIIEIDAASNRRVEETRSLLEQVRYTPTEVRYKVYIIDEVHMLTTEAFNTLLKTLEEPPAHVIFILATTDPNRLPATIISRCQRFEFRRVNFAAQVERLAYICEQEQLEIEEEALHLIARLSRGGMRDALSLLDQLVSYAGGKITYEHVVEMTGGLDEEQFGQLVEAIQARDVAEVLEQMTQMMSSGKSVDRAMESLIQYYRDLLLIKLLPDAKQLTDRMIDVTRFAAMASKLSEQEIFTAIDTLNHYHAEMRFASQPQTLFEVAILRLCTATPLQGNVTADEASTGVAGAKAPGAGLGGVAGGGAAGGAAAVGDGKHVAGAAGRNDVSPAALARQAIERQAAHRGAAGMSAGAQPPLGGVSSQQSGTTSPASHAAHQPGESAPQAGPGAAGQPSVPPTGEPGIMPPASRPVDQSAGSVRQSGPGAAGQSPMPPTGVPDTVPPASRSVDQSAGSVPQSGPGAAGQSPMPPTGVPDTVPPASRPVDQSAGSVRQSGPGAAGQPSVPPTGVPDTVPPASRPADQSAGSVPQSGPGAAGQSPMPPTGVPDTVPPASRPADQSAGSVPQSGPGAASQSPMPTDATVGSDPSLSSPPAGSTQQAPQQGVGPSDTPAAASSPTAPMTRGAIPASRSTTSSQGDVAPNQYSSEQRRRSEFEVFLQGMEGSQFQKVASGWSEVLAQVRKQKITVHAWLVDGAPVAATDQAVLVAFKNDIHRETTGKPDNTQLIEQVMASVLGQPLQLVTIMQSDWEDQLPTTPGDESAQPQEQFALEPEPEPTGKHKEPWINEAIDLFGEHLVKIEEDKPDE